MDRTGFSNERVIDCYIATHTQSLDIGSYESRILKKIIVKVVLYNTRILYKFNVIQSSNFTSSVILVNYIEISKLLNYVKISSDLDRLKQNSKF